MNDSPDSFFRMSGSSPPTELLELPREQIPAAIAFLSARLLEPEPEQKNGKPTENTILTPDEVAERLGVERKWVYAHKAELEGFNLSRKRLRFPSHAVERYIQRRKAATAREASHG